MLTLNSIRQFIRAHPGKVLVVAIAAVLYVAFNVWFFFVAKSGGSKTNPVGTYKGLTLPKQGETFSKPKALTPTPTPTSKTGPGPHGCDPYGVCNLYQPDLLREACTVTFADPDCMGACSDPAKRCKK